MDRVWVSRTKPGAGRYQSVTPPEAMADRVRRVGLDDEDIKTFYRVSISPARHERLRQFYSDELDALFSLDFEALDQQGKVDFLLLRNHLQRSSQQLHAEWALMPELVPMIPFGVIVTELCEMRESAVPLNGDFAAQQLDTIAKLAAEAQADVKAGSITASQVRAYKASQIIQELRGHIAEISSFYATYDPTFDWWVAQPLDAALQALAEYQQVVEFKLVGMKPDGNDEIIGQPIGREALLGELEAEMIAYAPEELLDIAHKVFAWCEEQMKTASNELGFGDDWKKALDYVKTQFVPPGEQTMFVKKLALEGAAFVKKLDLVTVPRVADETYRVVMMSPEMQKVAPFFLGGSNIMVSYPVADMSQDLKKMVMRGNNKHFAKATVFHELIPGHRLQFHYNQRYNSHRELFSTPFWMEGWALYWELLLWNRGDFFVSPEDRIGTMFWRMHRCARIIFSLKFHLGEWTPQQCVDLLVDWVGHERSTAEGEVRRSFNGSYPPLYQAGYMLGALQFDNLRNEVLDSGKLSEKQFHDEILKGGLMPVELVRAVLLNKTLTADYKPKWRFYD